MNAANTEIVIRSNISPVTVERRVDASWIEVARYKASGKRMAEEHAKWLNARHPLEEYRARELTPAKPMTDAEAIVTDANGDVV